MRTRHLVLGLLLSAVVLACSKQSEGERCELANADADCESGLLCTSARDLGAPDGVDRCCPPGKSATDGACAHRVAGTGGGPGTSSGGASPMPSGGAAGNAGTSVASGGSNAAAAGSPGAHAGSAGSPAGASNPG